MDTHKERQLAPPTILIDHQTGRLKLIDAEVLLLADMHCAWCARALRVPVNDFNPSNKSFCSDWCRGQWDVAQGSKV